DTVIIHPEAEKLNFPFTEKSVLTAKIPYPH
ncbi:MAG: hypothetical protein K0R28_4586, partial [Paenibacillus sp.]|nr:hypothetical protein [Paenibacillus sp.]